MPDTLPPRRLIVLTGPQDRGKQVANELITRSQLQAEQTLWLKPQDTALEVLGQEYALVVMDTYHGLNPDVFGRVSGLVQAGGALLILSPTLEDWPTYPDPEHLKLAPYPVEAKNISSFYLKRWVRLLSSLQGIERYRTETGSAIPSIVTSTPDSPPSRACTDDQQYAVDAVLHAVRGQRRRPAIITADRGRGKSAALGLAAGQLLASRQAKTIILTASRYEQLGSILKHAQAVLPDANQPTGHKRLEHPHGTLRYVAADALLEKSYDCDLLIVDEASTLGVARLEALLKRYPRIAFAGTEQGYEGSGRGFSLKFRQLIEAHCRGQYNVKLNTPVRWAENDPLEYWTNRLLLLDNALPGECLRQRAPDDELSFREITQSDLAEHEERLKQVMGLLINAHYQTRPVDCRYLLDAPNSLLFVIEQQDEIVALVWVMLEGGLDARISSEIVAGRRRPQGHLVPQILAAHLGLEQGITLSCARIQRIAVNPQLQGQGIGSWMLTQLEQHIGDNIDYLASSFGADLPLSQFWRRAGFHASRVSDKPQAASGLHSLVMFKPLSRSAHSLDGQLLELFRTQLIRQLADGLQQFSPALVCSLAQADSAKPDLTVTELKAAVLFGWARRPYDSSLAALNKIGQYSLFNTDSGTELDELTRHLFVTRILQNQAWSVCCEQLGIPGQNQGVNRLRQGTRTLLTHAGLDDEIAALRAQYEC